jgi:hypothetical protein
LCFEVATYLKNRFGKDEKVIPAVPNGCSFIMEIGNGRPIKQFFERTGYEVQEVL